jgi:hypothetical protein
MMARPAAAGFFWLLLAAMPACAAAPPGPPASADPARVAHEVFQDQRFWWKRIETRTLSISWTDSIAHAAVEFVGRILRAVGDLLGWILRALAGMFTGSGSGGSVAVRLIFAALVAWSIWKLWSLILRWFRATGAPAVAHEDLTLRTLQEASDLFEQGVRGLRAGMYAEAVRFALLALIARLEKQGLLRYDSTRTNREYQVELGGRLELAVRFGELARVYERAWYGRVPAGRADALQAINLCGSMIHGEDFAPL